MLLAMVLICLLAGSWAAIGCYALQDYSFSRMEELCEKRGDPDRFRQILTHHDAALLGLELLLTLSTLLVATGSVLYIGWPQEETVSGWSSIAGFVFEYFVFLVIALIALDIIPWTVARVASEPFLFRFWRAIQLMEVVFWPVLVVAKILDRMAHRLAGRGEPEEDDAAVINDEIITVLGEGEKEGLLESDATRMITRVLELRNEDVAAIMTPRVDMVCIYVESTIEEARQFLVESGHSRVPVIGESPDDVIGILYSKDLLQYVEPRRSDGTIPILRDLLREPFYVPVSTDISSLLEMMKRQKVQIAIVRDEYGVAGLVTMEDILEEIVGEIDDEYDTEETAEEVQQVDEHSFEVDARVHLDDLNSDYDLGFPDDSEFDTVGGFVFSQLGRVPRVGEVVVWERLRFTILEADSRRALRLRIETIPTESASTNADSVDPTSAESQPG